MKLFQSILVITSIIIAGLALQGTQGSPLSGFAYENPIPVAPTRRPSTSVELLATVDSVDSDENPCGYEPRDYDYPGIREAYDPISRKCYPVSKYAEGPCKENMRFYPRPDNQNYGFCDCDQEGPVIYRQDTDSCHVLFHQEYCDPGHWIQLHDDKPTCRLNPCFNSTAEQSMVLYEGNCVLLGTACGNHRTVGFFDGSFKPICGGNTFGTSNVGGGTISSLDCSKRGSRWSFATGKCEKTVSYTFSR